MFHLIGRRIYPLILEPFTASLALYDQGLFNVFDEGKNAEYL
jgi:hypothetical protein